MFDFSDLPLKAHIKNVCLERSKRRERKYKEEVKKMRGWGGGDRKCQPHTALTAFDTDGWRWQREEEEEEEGRREADGKELIHYASN